MPITREIECPSGLKGTIRNLTGRDGRYLANREVQRQGTMVDFILQNCWTNTIDPSIYKEHVTAAGPNWLKVLQGDRTYILLQIRIATHGPIYPFKAQCINEACVRRRFEWEIDLEDIPVKRLAEDSKRVILESGNRFMIRVPETEEVKLIEGPETAIMMPGKKRAKREIIPDTGTKLWFSLPVGGDEQRMLQERRQKKKRSRDERMEDNDLVDAVRMRVQEIEGVEKGRKNEGLVAYLEDCSMSQLAQMIDRFDEYDCGVETTIEIECPECSTIQEVDLPFDRNFFFPRKEKTALSATG